MTTIIFQILKKGAKFSLLLGFLSFILYYFGQYMIFGIYHLNLSLYFFFGTYLSNDVILPMTIGLVIFLLNIVYKIGKKAMP